jgi:hypothetical protein
MIAVLSCLSAVLERRAQSQDVSVPYEKLVSQLGAEDPFLRDEASRLLREAQYRAVPWISKALQNPDAEVRRRASELINAFKPQVVVEDCCPEVLKAFAYLPHVQEVTLLSLSADDDLGFLSSCKHLTHLHIYSKGLSDDGLKHLAGLTRLDTLQIVSPKVTGTGCQHVRNLKMLRTLKIGGPVTNEGLKLICALSSVRSLDLAGADISDEGIRQLAESLPHLAVIGIAEAKHITDNGIIHLAEHPRTLLVRFTNCPNITTEGQARLRKAIFDARQKRFEEGKQKEKCGR